MTRETALSFPSPLAFALLGPLAWWLPVMQATWRLAGANPMVAARVAVPLGTCGVVVAGNLGSKA
jgi:hypothetical protein